MEGKKKTAKIMDIKDMQRALLRISHEILERNRGTSRLAVVGIRTRGEHLALRISGIIKGLEGADIPAGVLDITLHRDDLFTGGKQPVVRRTEIPFDIGGMRIVLVDDVLFSGRTIRAALDELIDFGRPAGIQLAVLIDRGHRELPIRPDYVGKNVPTSMDETVRVKIKEVDGADEVVVEKNA